MPSDPRAFGTPSVIQGCFLTPPRLPVVQLQAPPAPPVAARARHVELAVQRGALQPRTAQSAKAPRVNPPAPAVPATLQRQATQQAGGRRAWQVSPAHANLAAATGVPLAPPVRQSMESLFGADFSAVRVHVGSQAPALGAIAFTHGSQLYFAPGHFAPQTPRGLQLLAHELTHVVQQRQGRVSNPFGAGLAVVQDPGLEAEAQRMSVRAAALPAPGQAAVPAGPLAFAAQRFAAPGHRLQAMPAPRFVSGTIQRMRLEYSNNFTEEITKYKGPQGHAKYYNQVVKQWLSGVKKSEFKNSMPQLQPGVPQSWVLVGQLIDSVNNVLPQPIVAQVQDVEVDTLGIPVSARTKIGTQNYPDIESYRQARNVGQGGKNHIELSEEIKVSILGKNDGASNVDALVSIGGKKFTAAAASETYRASFAVPFQEHEHEQEIIDSRGDGEVAVLSAALKAFADDFATGEEHKRSHRLALVGKYGACDGCKDRLRRFKELWRELATAAEVNAALTITYFYKEPSGTVDRPLSEYGWREARESSFKKKGKKGGNLTEKYYYRTYQSEHAIG